MPLAIELAGSWVRTLTCAEIVQAIARGSEMPNPTSQALAMWPHAIMSVFDRSWRMLTPEELQVLQRLAVFNGGCERTAAEDVAGATLPLLAVLVDKSLLRRAATGRYELHELVRQHALEYLLAAGEHELVQDRHLHYYLALAEEAVLKLRGAEQQAWLDRLEREHDNLRTALRWTLTKRERLEAGLRLVGALWWFWSIRGHLSEGRSWIEGLLRHESAEDAEAQAHARTGALIGAGGLACFQGDFEVARARLEESLSLGHKLGDHHTMAYAEALLGKVAVEQGHPETARTRVEQSLVLFQLAGDPWGRATALVYLGWALTLSGDLAGARARFEESLAIYRELGDQRGILAVMGGLGEVAWLQGDTDLGLAIGTEGLVGYQALGDKAEIAYLVVRLGDIALRQGDIARAEAQYNQGLALFQELGQKRGIAVTLQNLAQAALNRANPTAATTALIESMQLFHDLGDPIFMARNLVMLAEAARALGQGQRAARLLGTAERAWEETSVSLSLGDKIDLEQISEAVRADMPEALFGAAWAEGHALTREEAIAYALS
jgi:tetratricopeptide (TPR) repeat protein